MSVPVSVQQYSGKYYKANSDGRLYVAHSAAAGVTLVKYDNTSQVFALWNQSGVHELELVYLTLGGLAGAQVLGNLGFGIINAGFSIATGNISAFTKSSTTVWNMKRMCAGEAPAGKFAQSATVVAVAEANYVPFGLYMPGVYAVTDAATPMQKLRVEFDGTWIVPPGVCIVLAGNAAQSKAFDVTLAWIEHDI